MSNQPSEPEELLESLLSHAEPRPRVAEVERTPADVPGEDVNALVNELEEMIAEAKRVPFGRRLMIDEARALELVDRLRAAVPAEVRQANRIIDEQERILAEAHEEARRMLHERGLMAELDIERERMLARAEHEADRMRGEADAYVRQVLSGLEERLARLHASVRNGLEALSSAQEG